jgi:hypothetical protein
MYVFGAILIYTVGVDPFTVYTSTIFAILGLRAMYFLLLQCGASARMPLAAERPSRLKERKHGRLGFALVLLSMFFFYLTMPSPALLARRSFDVIRSLVFVVSAHGPPITLQPLSVVRSPHLAGPRRIPRGVDRGPLAASLFLQTDRDNPALQRRKNSAATSHPPIACGFTRRTRTFPPPMRRHAACSGCPWRSRTRFVGKRRAGAPPTAALYSSARLPSPRSDI